MRAKLLILFLGLLGLFVAVTAFRVDQLVYGDKLNASEAQARAQMGGLTEAVRADLNAVRDTLDLGWPQVLEAKKDYPRGRAYSRFQMMASLTRAGGDWAVENKFFLENSPIKNWAGNYATLALKGFKDARIPIGGTAVLALLDPTRKVYFLVISHTPAKWLAVVTGPELFQGALDRQKGQLGAAFVVNLNGQALAHTVPEYVGSIVTDDPVVQELMQSEASSGSGVFNSPQGQVQGFYEQVPQTNVDVVISVPMKALLAGRKDTRLQFIFLGIGFAFIGVAALLLLMRRLSEAPLLPQAPKPAPKPAAGIVADDDSPARKIRMDAYSRVAASVGHELRGPLLSLLGRARLLRETAAPGEEQRDLQKIEDGAREAFATLRKLLTFSGEQDEPVVDTSLGEVLQRTLRLMEARFKARGIQVETKIADTPLIQGQPNLLVKAFEQMLLNAVESMDRGLRKNLKITLSEGPRLVIEDSGEGIAADELEHIYDPFFTTKSAQGHSGLGLSLALGIIKASGGRVSCQSTRGQGTRFDIIFDAQAESIAPPEKAASQSASSAAAIPDSAGKPEPAPADMPEVLNDKLMERTLDMIDHLDEVAEPFAAPPEPPPFNPSGKSAESADAAPVESSEDAEKTVMIEPSEGHASPPSHEDFMKFTAKIDKPKAGPKRKGSRLLNLGTDVRRPGDRS